MKLVQTLRDGGEYSVALLGHFPIDEEVGNRLHIFGCLRHAKGIGWRGVRRSEERVQRQAQDFGSRLTLCATEQVEAAELLSIEPASDRLKRHHQLQRRELMGSAQSMIWLGRGVLPVNIEV
jgi:hypothetical protein